MHFEKIQLTANPQVSLSCYIQQPSPEMAPNQRKPGILILPGGGYQMCSDREAEPVALAFMHAGYNAFVLRYSVGEQATFPQPLRDAEAALGLIRENAEMWHTIADKIACIGFSAGGHLAASLAASEHIRPDALLIGYGALVRSEEHQWNFPTPLVDANTPQTFLFHTGNDELVPVDTSLYYASQLRQHQIPFELHIFQQGPHGLSLGDSTVNWGEGYQANRHYAQWLPLAVTWLNQLFEVYQ